MYQKNIPIKRALISVSDKTGIVEFARELVKLNIEIISTGGTSQLLRDAKIATRDVADVTGFPEMMDGRVKTLHPKVHGGILGQRDAHAAVAKEHGIDWIDLVVVNLYPFATTIQKPNVTFDDAVENIDIGGPTMIRSAAKNMGWVGVLVDPVDYEKMVAELTREGALTFATRQQLAAKAFAHTAQYDTLIQDYLHKQLSGNVISFPETITLKLEKYADLRYGENPHQNASAYQLSEQAAGVLSAKQHQGKQLSYNNIADADAAYACVREFSDPACVIVKHANPCGVAVADTILSAFQRAFAADSMSAFGGIVALNQTCDGETAAAIAGIFFEVLIAPRYTKEALDILAAKTNLRVLELSTSAPLHAKHYYKFIDGGLLIQDQDTSQVSVDDLEMVTAKKPNADDVSSLLFAWQVVKHIKSNAILLAKNNMTVGIGAGQVSRIDAVDLALRKADKNVRESVMASDAFFPFRDSIDRIAKTGVRAIIQPGGSVKDQEIIQACDEHGIAMVFTGKRCFKH